MTLWLVSIALMTLGIIGALFRRQILLVSLNIDLALLGAALGLIQASQAWENHLGHYLAFILLGLIFIHQILIFILARYLHQKFGTLHVDELRNLRG